MPLFHGGAGCCIIKKKAVLVLCEKSLHIVQISKPNFQERCQNDIMVLARETQDISKRLAYQLWQIVACQCISCTLKDVSSYINMASVGQYELLNQKKENRLFSIYCYLSSNHTHPDIDRSHTTRIGHACRLDRHDCLTPRGNVMTWIKEIRSYSQVVNLCAKVQK